jgi:iron complex transport system substrate-binding protein
MLVKAGGTNIAADAKSAYPQLTLEALVQKDPEVIILGDHTYGETPETVMARPGWANITAVKTGRIVPVTNQDIVNRPGPRVIEGLEFFAKAIHPDLFK